jgi:hypothetical protein
MMNAMLPLNLSRTKVCVLANLEPGRFFYHMGPRGHQLAVSLTPNPRHHPWLILSGELAFRIDQTEEPDHLSVLALGIGSGNVRLRVMADSPPAAYGEHIFGQVLFDMDDGPSIASAWLGQNRDSFGVTVALNSWRPSRLNAAKGGVVDDWALSFVDEAGEWVDLVTRHKPA